MTMDPRKLLYTGNTSTVMHTYIATKWIIEPQYLTTGQGAT